MVGWMAISTDSILNPSLTMWLGTNVLFWSPFIRDLLLVLGAESVEKNNFQRLMKEGQNLALIPGGFEEATLYQPGKHRIFLKNRKGFVKYALEHSYRLIPVYCFGEEQTFEIWQPPTFVQSFLLFLNKYGIPGVFPKGRWCILPDWDVDMRVVMGSPLELPTLDREPTREEVDEWHGVYMEHIQALFDKYKGQCAKEGEEATLEIL